jgi:hypothetical protein
MPTIESEPPWFGVSPELCDMADAVNGFTGFAAFRKREAAMNINVDHPVVDAMKWVSAAYADVPTPHTMMIAAHQTI